MSLMQIYLTMYKVKYLVIHCDGDLLELDIEHNRTLFHELDYDTKIKKVVMFRAIDKDTFEVWL